MSSLGPGEKDTCRDYVLPKLRASGWNELDGSGALQRHLIQKEYPITFGRIILSGKRARREKQGRAADYVLEHSAGLPLAVVEAKRQYRSPSDGLRQAKSYAEQLDLPVAYATNGLGIIEFDFHTGQEREVDMFARPDELWQRYRAWKGIVDDRIAEVLSEPFNRDKKDVTGTPTEPRYYQRVAIHRAVVAILNGDKRLLLTMATGTGKTFTAMQIVWKVWRYWMTGGGTGNERVLYLADRDVLISTPIRKDFRPAFGDAVHRILGESTTSRSIYFATYQSLTAGASPRYRDYPPNYFDLIIVDECHRGSSRDESTWREVLEYFKPATQLGMTATPKRDDNVDTYRYFRNHLYTYTLRQGIEDGFLAPYRVRRVVLSPDAYGYRPDPGEVDRFKREIPDELYTTAEFERVVSLLTRTEAAAQYLTRYLRGTDRMAKMVIFCVDSEHAADMRRAMTNANSDAVAQHANYVERITSKDGYDGEHQLDRFQDEDSNTPVVVTTAKLLSTGVDIPTLRTVVLFKPIRSIVEFKQIIGRGTRLAPEYDKLSFEIIDFTGATLHFEDPDFDGPADIEIDEVIDGEGDVVDEPRAAEPHRRRRSASDDDGSNDDGDVPTVPWDARKFYVDDLEVHLIAEGFLLSRPGSDHLELVEYRDYVADTVRKLCPTPTKLRSKWRSAPTRIEITNVLAGHGIDLEELQERTGLADSDPFDVLVHVAWNLPTVSRQQRIRQARAGNQQFFGRFSPAAREVLDLLLDRYADHGIDDLTDLRVLELEPISDLGSVVDIADRFDTPERLHGALVDLQALLYAA